MSDSLEYSETELRVMDLYYRLLEEVSECVNCSESEEATQMWEKVYEKLSEVEL